jgi:menaquinone-dependent protoporphyrinogen oxidase
MNAMNRLPVFYATSEGHTRRIAETIASVLREKGFESEPVSLSDSHASPDWSTIVGAVVGASLHAGRHQKSAENFVRREVRSLNDRPSAFFSVSLSAGSRNPTEVAAARDIAARFVRAAEWEPRRVACFPGKLAYTQYGFFSRWFMRRIAAREGGPTDTSRDHDLTDWTAVREFARNVADDARRSMQTQAAS